MKTYPRVKDLLQKDIDSGMSLREVCRKVDLHPNTVGNYLEGRSEPKVDSLEKIAAAYHVKVAWLRGDSDVETAPPDAIPDTIDLASLDPERRALWDAVDKLPATKVKKILALLDMLEAAD